MLVIIFLLAGCAGQGKSTQPSTDSSEQTPLTAPTVIASSKAEEWVYVALGDSITFYPVGQGFIDIYAKMLEEDLGVKIDLNNLTKGGDESNLLLERIRNDSELRETLQKAEVITCDIPLGGLREPWLIYEGLYAGECGGTDNQDCLRAAFDQYKSDMDNIIAEIVALSSPSKVLIRIMDTYPIPSAEMKKSGSFEVVNAYWREANAHLAKTATNYSIPVAPVYETFMGAEGSGDSINKWLSQDGIHPNVEGAALIAKLFQDIGYTYAPAVP